MKLTLKKHRTQSLYMHAFHVYRDWLILLLVAVSILTASMLFHVYLFYQVQNDSAIESGSVGRRLTVNRTELRDVIDSYTKKKINFEGKNYNLIDVVDPSL